MNNTRDVILVNRCNQSDEFRTVLPAKMCVQVLLILMLAAAAVLVVGAGVGAAATWYVDDGGGAGIDFTKIQDAVSNASAGDTIYVYEGMYNEHVLIPTSITLSGQSESNVTIDGDGSGDCVQISSSDVAINGFTITNASRYGIRADYSDIAIENVTITANGGHGIYFVHGKSFTIRNSIIDGNAGGIIYYYAASGDAIVEDNTVTNNVGSGVRISLAEGKSATVKNNKIDNSAGGSSDGMYVYIAGSGGVMDIENNPVTKSGQRGIYLRGVRAGSTVANFTVHDSETSGIRADASDLTIENVTVTNSGGNGIYFYSAKDFTIRDCTIDGNAGGIIYAGNRATGDAIVEDNIITNNIGSGLRIGLTEGKSATVRNNKVDNNAGGSSDGIYVYIAGTGGLMTIENNPVTNSGRRGIYLRGVRRGSTIADFAVQGSSGGSGIRADASDMTLENVTVTDSDNYGIYFYSGKGFAIRDSTIDGNDWGGIVWRKSRYW